MKIYNNIHDSNVLKENARITEEQRTQFSVANECLQTKENKLAEHAEKNEKKKAKKD